MTQQFHSQVDMRELRTCPHRNLSMNVNSSGIQNSQKMETVQGSIIPLMSCRNLYFTSFPARANAKTYSRGTHLVHIQDSWRKYQNNVQVIILNWVTSHHQVLFLLLVLAHWDGVLRWNHIPKSITSQDNILVLLGVKSVDTCVWFRWHHKLTTEEIIAPQITWGAGGRKSQKCYFQESSIPSTD